MKTEHATSSTSVGLRDRLFATLDGVMNGTVKKDQVEAVCFISQEILKSARVDLEFEEAAQRKLRLQIELEREKGDSMKMLANTINNVTDIEEDEDD